MKFKNKIVIGLFLSCVTLFGGILYAAIKEISPVSTVLESPTALQAIALNILKPRHVYLLNNKEGLLRISQLLNDGLWLALPEDGQALNLPFGIKLKTLKKCVNCKWAGSLWMYGPLSANTCGIYKGPIRYDNHLGMTLSSYEFVEVPCKQFSKGTKWEQALLEYERNNNGH